MAAGEHMERVHDGARCEIFDIMIYVYMHELD